MRQQLKWSNFYPNVFLFFLCGWIFLIPSNLFLKFGENQAYVHGLLVDYLLPKLYLSDFFSLALLGLSWWTILKQERRRLSLLPWPKILVLGIFLLGLRQFFTPHPLAAVWFAFHLLMIGLLGWGLQFQTIFLKKPVVFFTLVSTIFFQTLVASYQFWAQKALFGYWFLGEPDLLRGIGIAAGVFAGAEKILPYGTTAHPNILAGTMVVYTWGALLLFFRHSQKTWLFKLLLGLSLTCCLSLIYLTQSWTAFVALVIGITILLIDFRRFSFLKSNKVLGGLLVVGTLATPVLIHQVAPFFPDATSLSRRDFLNQAAITSWRSQPFWGVGLNQTTATIENFSPSLEVVRFVQPIHHLGLLWLSETGMLGIIVIGLFWFYIHKKWSASNVQTHLLISLCFLLPILVLDHYLLTLNTGQLAVVLSFWFGSQLFGDENQKSTSKVGKVR